MISSTLGTQLVPMSIVAVVALIAAVIDVRVFKVHNRLTLPLVLSGLLFNTIQGGVNGLAFSLAGLLVGFASLIVFYAMGGIGAGDVKLLAGIGAWVHVTHTCWAFAISGIIGAILAVLMVLYQRTWGKHSGQFWLIVNANAAPSPGKTSKKSRRKKFPPKRPRGSSYLKRS